MAANTGSSGYTWYQFNNDISNVLSLEEPVVASDDSEDLFEAASNDTDSDPVADVTVVGASTTQEFIYDPVSEG
jgi:hypothetical protein